MASLFSNYPDRLIEKQLKINFQIFEKVGGKYVRANTIRSRNLYRVQISAKNESPYTMYDVTISVKKLIPIRLSSSSATNRGESKVGRSFEKVPRRTRISFNVYVKLTVRTPARIAKQPMLEIQKDMILHLTGRHKFIQRL